MSKINPIYLDCRNLFESCIEKKRFLENPEGAITERNEFAGNIYAQSNIAAFKQDFNECIFRFSLTSEDKSAEQFNPPANPEVWLLNTIKSLLPTPMYLDPEQTLNLHNGYDAALLDQIEKLERAIKGMNGLAQAEIDNRMHDKILTHWGEVLKAIDGIKQDSYSGKSKLKDNKPIHHELMAIREILDEFKLYFPTAKITGSPTSFCHNCIGILLKYAQHPFTKKELRSRIANAQESR